MLNMHALNKPGGIFNHVLDVAQYEDWGKNYLTIIDNHVLFEISDPDNTKKIYLTYEGDYLPLGTVITAVNGKSTKNMSPSEFYELTDNADSFELKCYRLRDTKETKHKINVLRQIKEEIINYSAEELRDHSVYYSNWEKRKRSNDGKLKKIIQEMSDNSFDFSKVKTYDFLINSNEPLVDKKIFEKMSLYLMTRDTIKPDVIFTVAKSTEESVSATYVPPTSRTVYTGSTTQTNYNYLTHKNEYETTQNYKTVREGGYTETTSIAHTYLELTALDAKQINNPKKTHAPIIWQMVAKRDVVNPKSDYNTTKELLAYASWAEMPPYDRWCKRNGFEERAGLVQDDTNPSLIAEVHENSQAQKTGLQKGDIILRFAVEWKSWTDRYNKNRQFRYNENGKSGLVTELNELSGCNKYEKIKVTIKRGKDVLTLKILPYTPKFILQQEYWLTPQQLKEVQDPNK